MIHTVQQKNNKIVGHRSDRRAYPEGVPFLWCGLRREIGEVDGGSLGVGVPVGEVALVGLALQEGHFGSELDWDRMLVCRMVSQSHGPYDSR